jgi:multimeric flavodoxin WrbA
MKTICLLGSPRRGGNSDTLAQRFVQKAAKYGVLVETVTLSKLSYNGCINLFECKKQLLHCGQNDDLTPVLQTIAQAEVLVLASPIYFTNISGQTKLAIDRFFSFFVPDYLTATVKSRLTPNRHIVLLQTQGEPENRYADILDQYSASFNGLGFNNMHLVRAWGVREPNDVEASAHFLKNCDDVVSKIYKPTCSPISD